MGPGEDCLVLDITSEKSGREHATGPCASGKPNVVHIPSFLSA